MKILVTGAPGTGKTTLVEYAIGHGADNFLDTDKLKGLCEWRSYETGNVLGSVEDTEPQGGESWYKTCGWYWIKSRMNEITTQVDDPIICGSADNVMEFYNYFDKVVLLYKSREDLVSNLLQPGREQPNGKSPEHHERILLWQEKLLSTLKPYSPLIIEDNNIETVFNKVSAITAKV